MINNPIQCFVLVICERNMLQLHFIALIGRDFSHAVVFFWGSSAFRSQHEAQFECLTETNQGEESQLSLAVRRDTLLLTVRRVGRVAVWVQKRDESGRWGKGWMWDACGTVRIGFCCSSNTVPAGSAGSVCIWVLQEVPLFPIYYWLCMQALNRTRNRTRWGGMEGK